MSWPFPVSVTTPTSVLLSLLRRLSKHRYNHTDQSRKRQHVVDGVRILPLHTQLIPVRKHNGPVLGRLICREGPDKENGKGSSN